MEDRERDQALMDGFTFGARLVRLAHDIDDQHPKHLTLLEGKATSLEGAAELLRRGTSPRSANSPGESWRPTGA